MAKYDLENYETVKSRKKRFYQDYPDGRIIVELQNVDSIMDYALMKATVYRTHQDQRRGLAAATGYAHEIRETELKTSKSGYEYESVNYSSWCENCEESAVGRALDNFGYSSNGKCSQEEMKKVQKMSNNYQQGDKTDMELIKVKEVPKEYWSNKSDIQYKGLFTKKLDNKWWFCKYEPKKETSI